MLLNLYLQACLPLSPPTWNLFFSFPYHRALQHRTISGHGCLISGAWLPLGFRENALDDRGHLFEPQASCVPCSPPLAFFRELRGTAPGIHQHPGQETVLRVPGATMTQHPIKQKKPPHLHDLPKRKSCSVRRFFA